jgi:hypothetical protein
MKKTILGFVMLAFAFSCNEDVFISKESVHKGNIETYFERLKKADSSISTTIDQLSTQIDYGKVGTLDLITSEQLLIADLKERLSSNGKTIVSKILFFMYKGKIDRSLIANFEDQSNVLDYNSILNSIVNLRGRGNYYSGKISFYESITKHILAFKEFNRGQLQRYGETIAKDISNKSGKTNSCTDWYLVTTYYGWGGSYQTEQYVFTTCENRPKGCEIEISRIGRITDCSDNSAGATGNSLFNGIDCSSFYFIGTANNWQEAAITNIKFQVKIVDLDGSVISVNEMKITKPIWFGLPAIRWDGSTVSAGKAAEIAASAVQYASDLTHLLYLENPNTPISTAESVFMGYLKSKLLTDGGRADFNGSGASNVITTSAEYRFWGNGNCE